MTGLAQPDDLRALCLRLLDESQTLRQALTYARARLKQEGKWDDFYEGQIGPAYANTMGPRERAETQQRLRREATEATR